MLLSNTNHVLNSMMTEAESIQFMAAAGYDAFDMSFTGMLSDPDNPWNQDNYREYALELKKIADEAGIVCNQAHAPYDNKCGDADFDVEFLPKLYRSIECAALLGAKIIVVHPIHNIPHSDNIAVLREKNIEFYKSLIPYCEKYGIKVAAENMWQRKWNPKRCFHSSCSRAEEFCDYIDTIGREWIVACLDLGHAGLVREDPARMIYMLGHRLQALHVHDNDHMDDLHGIPLFHCMDFDTIIKALADIDYQGDFTYEAADFYKKLPRRAWKSVTEMMVEIGRYFIEEIENQKQTK